MVTGPFNRQARRRMAVNAKHLALKLSRTALDYDRSGSIVRVVDHLAQAVLARAFERMLQAGGLCHVLRLTEAEAASFPRGGRPPSPGAEPWLAVGIDVAGSATYALRWLGISSDDPAVRQAIAAVAMRRVIATECASAGFPVAGHA